MCQTKKVCSCISHRNACSYGADWRVMNMQDRPWMHAAVRQTEELCCYRTNRKKFADMRQNKRLMQVTDKLKSCAAMWQSEEICNNNNNDNRIERRNSRFLLSPDCAAKCLQHVRSSGPGVIVCWSRATLRALITCNVIIVGNVVRRDTSAIKFDRVLNRIYFSFILLPEPLTYEGGEKTGVPGENPRRRASEKNTY